MPRPTARAASIMTETPAALQFAPLLYCATLFRMQEINGSANNTKQMTSSTVKTVEATPVSDVKKMVLIKRKIAVAGSAAIQTALIMWRYWPIIP